jgi:hypothetical protein
VIDRRDLPALTLGALFATCEAGYATHRWRTVSQEYARFRGAHPAAAAMSLGMILSALAIHLGFGWENALGVVKRADRS